MPVRGESSINSTYWPQNESSSFIAGLLEQEPEATTSSSHVNKKQEATPGTSEDRSRQAVQTSSNDGKGKERAVEGEGEEDEDEITFNPDMELAAAQYASGKHDYEDQGFYGSIKFGEFGKYMANKRRKLSVQQGAFRLNADETSKSELLKGLRIHVNGLTEPPAHELQKIIVNHGGFYVQYLDAKKTSATHIIASNLTPSKRIAFKAYKVVIAAWLLDSIRDKKIKDWRLYREDAVQPKARDLGTGAPAGTQIAQPQLRFGTQVKLQTVQPSLPPPSSMAPPPPPPAPVPRPKKRVTFVGVEVPVRKRPKVSPPAEAVVADSDKDATGDKKAAQEKPEQVPKEPPKDVRSILKTSGEAVRRPRKHSFELIIPIIRRSKSLSKSVSPPQSERQPTSESAVTSVAKSATTPSAATAETVSEGTLGAENASGIDAQTRPTEPRHSKRSTPAVNAELSPDSVIEPPIEPVQPKAPVAGVSTVSPAAKASPRRLPPPTSDALTLLEVESAVVDGATSPAGKRTLAGWHPTAPNARSAEALKSEDWRKRETAVSSDFLGKYYTNSRLHWLSTWKAELKRMVGELSENREMDLNIQAERRKRGPLKGTEEDGRVVLHVDFDSFFVSASLLSRKHLLGQPVVVCHASGGDVASSSEIASASYEAREFGIKNGMSLGSCRAKCPNLQTVPYEFELYRSISNSFYSILFSHAFELEAVSIDEAYISLPSSTAPRGGAALLQFAEKLRAEIREATGCYTSVGVSHNKLLARLATNRAKPSSSFQVGNGTKERPSKAEVAEFLKDIDIESLPQIGWKRANEIEEKLKELDARLKKSAFNAKKQTDPVLAGEGQEEEKYLTVGQLLKFQKNQLKEVLGEKTGEMLWNYARGIDPRELEMESIRKSVSAEVNYGIRFKAPSEVETFMHGLGAEVSSRLIALGFHGRQLTLKVMKRAEGAPLDPPKFMGHGVCDVFNASRAVELTNDPKVIGRIAWELMQSLAVPPEELRGIGLQMQKLEKLLGREPAAGAREDGQGKLAFKPKERSLPVPVEEDVSAIGQGDDMPPPAPRQPDLAGPRLLPKSPIVVPDSTSSPHFNDLDAERLQRGIEPKRSTRPRQLSVSYIDLSSEDEGFAILSQAPLAFRGNQGAQQQALLGGKVVKRPLAPPQKPKKVITIAATQDQPPPDPGRGLPNPAKLTEKHLTALGLSASYFQACSRLTQLDILRDCLAKTEIRDLPTDLQNMVNKAIAKAQGQSLKKKKEYVAPVFQEAKANFAKAEDMRRRMLAKEAAKAQGRLSIKLIKPEGAVVPSFGEQSSLDGVRSILKEWMDGVGSDCGPELDEVEQFGRFCMHTASPEPLKNGGYGADIAKVVDLLRWWEYLISRREKAEVASASQRSAASAWRDAYESVRGEVGRSVEESWGAALSPSLL